LGEKPKTQSDKFKDVARKAGCDEDEKRWEERLKKDAKAAQGPAPEPRDPEAKKKRDTDKGS
jgi:hypothetical protein